ncbi:hypothetical protein, partial [Lishizhenia sp.]|uniref:hypothetical protein n=1 Tax=Lishizhenia sp. TaxID=2497594 RepID=UPI00299D2C59
VPLQLFAMGFSDWEQETPYGNKINNFTEGCTLYLRGKTFVEHIKNWYFYKGHTIGEITQTDQPKGYFAADEINNVVIYFDDENDWKNYIEKEDLSPKLVTRWHKGDWKVFDTILLLSLFYFFFTIPLLILFVVAVVRAIRKEKFKLSEPYTLSVLFIVGFIVLRLVLDAFPQSI